MAQPKNFFLIKKNKNFLLTVDGDCHGTSFFFLIGLYQFIVLIYCLNCLNLFVLIYEGDLSDNTKRSVPLREKFTVTILLEIRDIACHKGSQGEHQCHSGGRDT